MDFTVELSKVYNVIPFEIFKQDKDEVIMLINYFIEKSQHKGEQQDVELDDVNLTEKDIDRATFWNAL